MSTGNSAAQNPNFPDFLNIQPSQVPHYLQTHLADSFGLRAQEEAIRRYGIAGRVWEAAYAMLLYVQPGLNLEFDPPFISPSDPRPLTMIELGSGSGAVAAAVITGRQLGEDDLVIVTDLPEVCSQLHANLSSINSASLLAVRPLAWGNFQHASLVSSDLFQQNRTFTHIICSDLVYFPHLLAPLLRSLIHLTSPSFSMVTLQSPRVIMSYKIRSLAKESPFWSAFGLWFEFSPLLVKKGPGRTRWERFGTSSFDDGMFVFVARRRPLSFQWQVPSDDSDLLSGMGALGTNSKKGDDTFESLLLMAIN